MTYTIIALHADTGREELREYSASMLNEALAMAEQDDAYTGRYGYIYGVRAEDFDLARQEGIEFNEADGLLV